ncbi:MAG: GrdX family protein [Dethiobacteria bacterium]
MGFFLVTNNPLVGGKYPNLTLDSFDGSLIELLIRVRNYVHMGHSLLTHPLSGSLKPGRIPYKTIALSCSKNGLDLLSLQYIENSIEVSRKTALPEPESWSEETLSDYAVVDLSHLEAALEAL